MHPLFCKEFLEGHEIYLTKNQGFPTRQSEKYDVALKSAQNQKASVN